MHNTSKPSLDVTETLIMLAIASSFNKKVNLALKQLPKLKNVEMHTTHLTTKGDEEGIRNLKINLTTDAEISEKIHII